MEIKTGDLLQNRYKVKAIILDPEKNFKEFSFILYDKEKEDHIIFSEKDMQKLLDIKEV